MSSHNKILHVIIYYIRFFNGGDKRNKAIQITGITIGNRTPDSKN